MLTEQPYFMTNNDWWKRDEERDMIVLSPRAPKTKKVLNSYREYVKAHNMGMLTRGGTELDFDIDNDEEFNKFINEIMGE